MPQTPTLRRVASAAVSTPSSSNNTTPDVPASPRPTRGIKRRLPTDLTPLVERTSSSSSQTQSKSSPSATRREGRNGSTASAIVNGSLGSPTRGPDGKRKKGGSRRSGGGGDDLSIEDRAVTEETLSEEDKKKAELFDGWREEYFEIVEQLPLEMHRSFSLIRELDSQVRAHMDVIRKETLAYRDYRVARHLKKWPGEQRKKADGEDLGLEITPSGTDAKPLPSTNGDASSILPTSTEFMTPQSDARETTGKPVSERLEVSLLEEHSLPSNHPQVSSVPVVRYERHPSLSQISRACSSAIASSEEKVGLALAVYKLIDRQCRRLDADLAKLADSGGGETQTEASLPSFEGLRTGTMESRKSQKLGGGAVAGNGSNVFGSSIEEGSATQNASTGSRRSGRGRNSSLPGPNDDTTSRLSGALETPQMARDDPVPNMAVDPNEPVYCYCRGPSHGLMVGCDNDDCPYEWFHLSCLGLDKPPGENRQWFCQDCSGGGGTNHRDAHTPTTSSSSNGKAGKKAGGGGTGASSGGGRKGDLGVIIDGARGRRRSRSQASSPLLLKKIGRRSEGGNRPS